MAMAGQPARGCHPGRMGAWNPDQRASSTGATTPTACTKPIANGLRQPIAKRFVVTDGVHTNSFRDSARRPARPAVAAARDYAGAATYGRDGAAVRFGRGHWLWLRPATGRRRPDKA